MIERKSAVTSKGKPKTLLGPEIKVGDKAPGFVVVGANMADVNSSKVIGEKAVLLSAVPSLDTGICDQETRRFNEEAGKWGDKVRVVTISIDTPFAQKRWCGAAGIENVETYSDFKDRAFSHAYGCYIKEIGILSRAVFVVDKGGVMRYVEYVQEVAQHPDYESALAAIESLI